MGSDDRGLAVVTGATSGFGRAVAAHLAEQDHDLVVVARAPDRADDLLADLAAGPGSGSQHVLLADLSSVGAVGGVVDEIVALDRPVGLLINNAGAVYGLRRRQSVDGIELTMALNHLAYVHLTLGLLPQLSDVGARVVNVASDAYTYAGGRFDFDDWQARRRYRPHRQYGMSKLANILFTHELQRRHGADGIDAVAWAPSGLTATRFGYGANRLAPALMKLTHPFAAETDEAVAPLFDLLATAELGERRGAFVCGSALHPVEPCTDEDAERLWELSEQLIAEALAAAKP